MERETKQSVQEEEDKKGATATAAALVVLHLCTCWTWLAAQDTYLLTYTPTYMRICDVMRHDAT